MHIDEIIWEKKRDIASVVALGAINRAPTRCGVWATPAPQARVIVRPQARRGPIYRAQARAAAMCQPVAL